MLHISLKAKGHAREKNLWEIATDKRRFRPSLLLGACALGIICSAATAQTQSSAADSDQEQAFGDIIVTAQRREQKLQNVPFGISAFGEKDLERSGAVSGQDFLVQVPGVHFTPLGRGRSAITIRGVSTEGGTLNNLQRAVEVYLDELPLLDRFSVWTAPDIGTFDIERVEVLRGPQGTLFGSGALGGAVRMITNKPNLSEFQGKLELGVATTRGGEDSNDISGMFNMPVVQGKLGLRLVAYRRFDGGYIDNIVRGEKDVDSGKNEGGRAILEYRPDDRLKVNFTALYDRARLDDSARTFNDNLGPSDQWDGIIPERSDAKLYIYSLGVDYDLGFATVSSISTYGKRNSYLATDFVEVLSGIANTALDPDGNDLFIVHNSKRYAQEIRLASSGSGPLQWTIGGFLMKYRQDIHQIFSLGPPQTLILDDRLKIKLREAALFGEATYRLTEQLSVTAGARWFDNRFQLERNPNPAALLASTTPLTKSNESAFTPKFSVSFFPSPEAHLYATVSRGFRIGQTNFSAGVSPLVPDAYAPDSVWNYEIGFKGSLFDRRLSVDVAAYYIDWSNIQLSRSILLPNGLNQNFTDNAGKARVKGIEADFVFRPVDALEIGAVLSYNDAKLKSILPGVPYVPGSRLPGSAKFTSTNYIQASANFSETIAGYIRFAHMHVGKVNSDLNLGSSFQSDNYSKFDVRAGITTGPYEFVVYMNNIFDTDAAVSRTNIVKPVPYAYRVRPRTIGVTARAGF